MKVEFSTVSKDAWIQQAIADLKGGDFEKKLVWNTPNGYPVQPFYTQEDRQVLEDLDSLFPKTTPFQEQPRYWKNWQRVSVSGVEEVSGVNRKALDLLEKGADAILFDVENTVSVPAFSTLLQGINLSICDIGFAGVKKPVDFAKGYLAYVEGEGTYNLADLAGFIQLSSQQTTPIAEWAALLNELKKAPGINGVVLDTGEFTNQGANQVQALAYGIAKLADVLDGLAKAGIAPNQVLQHTTVIWALGGDYFHEIAACRALRYLFKALCQSYQSAVFAPQIIATTGLWNKSALDTHVNMLRNTTEAMSGILGGADGICIYAHDGYGSKGESAIGQRIALNISHILREESYLGKVVDPAAGSYYLETITRHLAEAAIDLWKKVEATGGYELSKEEIAEAITRHRNTQVKAFEQRRFTRIGVNKYPNGLELEPDLPNFSKSAVDRLASGFEQIRARTEQAVKAGIKRPHVHLALWGDVTMRQARATFSSDLLGLAGFTLSEHVYETVDLAQRGAIQSKADLIVLCSSDADYETEATVFATAVTAAKNRSTLILAGYPEAILEGLKQAGVDYFIHLRMDVPGTLEALQNQLFTNTLNQ